MNVIECMEKRHSTRQFSTRKVEKEKLEQTFFFWSVIVKDSKCISSKICFI